MPRPKKTCPHCKPGEQTFGYLSRRWVFDVDAAHEIVRDGRAPVEMEPADVRHCVDNSRIHEQHLPHVDTRFPGIIAHFWWPDREGSLIRAHLLIDGNHRAARCLQLNRPFFAHVLDEEESLRVTLKSPLRPVYDLLTHC